MLEETTDDMINTIETIVKNKDIDTQKENKGDLGQFLIHPLKAVTGKEENIRRGKIGDVREADCLIDGLLDIRV